MDKYQEAFNRVVGLARARIIQWSVLCAGDGRFQGYLGEIPHKQFDLAILDTPTGRQLWAVRKDKKRSVFLPGDITELVALAEHAVACQGDGDGEDK